MRRRTLRLPDAAVEALREHRERQDEERLEARALWHENDLVFVTSLGGPLDPGNVRRSLRAICKAAGISEQWTSRELRTWFVALMSHRGVSAEEIARLVGHSRSRTTEVIYRKELRPVITTGAGGHGRPALQRRIRTCWFLAVRAAVDAVGTAERLRQSTLARRCQGDRTGGGYPVRVGPGPVTRSWGRAWRSTWRSSPTLPRASRA